ncbi:short-chain dehydrogenase/reductase 3 isoform X1 [Lagenorhynchus albirostris]|uniref:short-chain dehydrogenase/reductase 3 isoform X1 n=2 Tax=Lagenorhynchus albirostris TaxID=27610 RepID=UPI0028E2ADEF|nr:short-chain dehydrogenase/reductase 3 isoform X1 [Lagenorhynchus albirostris]
MLTREREGAGSSGNSQPLLEERGREGAEESGRARGRAMHMIYLVVKAAVGLVLPAKLRDLSRENVLITGGGRGIGRQLAREFAERGARKIVLWGRTEKCLKETTEEIRQMGTECHYFICDVGNREEVYQTAKAVREKVGDITILVNNAAVVHGKSLMDSDDDALLKSQHINTLGQFWTTKAFLPRMLELQNGHIVCLNSVLALSAIPGAIDYCTSKASAFAFMESLTLGLLDCPGVSATTVLPFHTSTEMFQGMRVRFPNLFPPLKPETVARRTVEAVQLNQALLLLPWTMHALIILKRPFQEVKHPSAFIGCQPPGNQVPLWLLWTQWASEELL